MPTTGRNRVTAPVEPRNWASPKAKTPPSAATIEYPNPAGGAEEAGVAVGADPAVRCHQPVAGVGGRGGHGHDGLVEADVARRAEEGRGPEGEDAAVPGRGPVTLGAQRGRGAARSLEGGH